MSECQTPGARFTTAIGVDGVTIRVELPPSLAISKRDAVRLEASIHNALELAFAPLFATHAPPHPDAIEPLPESAFISERRGDNG